MSLNSKNETQIHYKYKMLVIAKGLKRQRTMLEITWNPLSHKDHYVIYVYLSLSELGNRNIKDIIPNYVPNICSFECVDDNKQVLYMPLIPQLKDAYLQNNNTMRKRLERFMSDNIDYILRNPGNNKIADQTDQEIATAIGNEIINNLRPTKYRFSNKKEIDRKCNILMILLIFVMIFVILSWR